MRQNTLRTTHVPKPIIVNQAAYRAAVERRVERYGPWIFAIVNRWM